MKLAERKIMSGKVNRSVQKTREVRSELPF